MRIKGDWLENTQSWVHAVLAVNSGTDESMSHRRTQRTSGTGESMSHGHTDGVARRPVTGNLASAGANSGLP